jgi:tol-pal system protein YbgF
LLGAKSTGTLPGEGPVRAKLGGARRSFGVLLALCVIGLAGCAEFTGTAVHEDSAQLRQDLNALTLTLHRTRSDTETLLGQIDRRTREQSAEIQKQLATLQSRTDSLNSELTRLAGRVDELTQRLGSLSRQSGARPAPPAGSARPAPPSPRPSGPGGPPTDLYQAAYIDFSKGNYPLALAGFQEFLRRYPNSDLADHAQYWIGEAHFSLARNYAAQGQGDKALRALEQAVQEFRKVIVNHPRGEKVPTALYKEALALLELKQENLAQARLRYLLDHFPQSEEAPLARERLAGLRESSR